MENGSGWKNNPAKEGLAVGCPRFPAQAGVGMGERDLVGTQPGLSLLDLEKLGEFVQVGTELGLCLVYSRVEER